MPIANQQQIERFKKEYCLNNAARISIADHFSVAVESFEELLPGNTVRSYATGNRAIDGAFIVFRVTNPHNDIEFYPVFSESVGRTLVRAWNLDLPRKMSILVGDNLRGGEAGGGQVNTPRNPENQQMLLLIQFVRSMMILHIDEPEPMRDPFKKIYKNLYAHPNYGVTTTEIKSINTATKNYLLKPINTRNESFHNLQGYIDFVQHNYPDKKLRAYNFDGLRDRMRARYPDETIVF